MTSGEKSQRTWDYVYRPKRMVWYAIGAAIVILIIHIVFGSLLTISDTGPANIGTDDQLAIMLIGVLVAGVALLLTRSRLRVGPDGVGVRNVLNERVFDWDRVNGLSYPDKGISARLQFPEDEHVPVLAVQASDGDRAVTAMARFRELQEQYTADSKH